MPFSAFVATRRWLFEGFAASLDCEALPTGLRLLRKRSIAPFVLYPARELFYDGGYLSSGLKTCLKLSCTTMLKVWTWFETFEQNGTPQ